MKKSQIIDLTEDTDSITAMNPNEQEDTLVVVNGIPFTKREKCVLQNPIEWLTDEIINAYCSRLANKNPLIHCCSTFFYTRISTKFDPEWLNKWRSTVKSTATTIFVPINWGNSHWAMTCYNLKEGILRYYDSMLSSHRSREALVLLKRTFKTCGHLPPNPALSAKKKDGPIGVLAFVLSKMSLKEADETIDIRIEIPAKQPQQTDGSSCGVFVCWWIAQLSLQIPTEKSIDIIAFRDHILNTILNG